MKGQFTLTLVSLIIALGMSGCVTPTTVPPAEQKYTEIFEFKGIKKNDLFVRANTWFVSKFVSADSVIQFADKDSGKIAGKYYSELAGGVLFFGVRQTIEVDVKDEKVRIVFHSPTSISLGNAFGMAQGKPKAPVGNWGNVVIQQEIDAIYADWKKLAASFKEKLSQDDTF